LSSCPACSIAEVLHNIDIAIQYGEDAEVKIRDFDEPEAGEEDDGEMMESLAMGGMG